jgi:hypothetical protein
MDNKSICSKVIAMMFVFNIVTETVNCHEHYESCPIIIGNSVVILPVATVFRS